MKKRSSLKNYICALAGVAALLLLDQYTKLLAVRKLMGKEPVVIWKGVFELQYLENRGAAFGMFQDAKVYFIILTAAVLAVVAVLYKRTPDTGHYLPLRLCIVCLTAGALGNFADRLFRGYVVDFFYFSLINFPVFNVADIYITVTFVILALLILFYYSDEDLKVYSRK